MKNVLLKLRESLVSILPITVLGIVAALITRKIDGGLIGLFAVGSVFLIVGMTLFTVGTDLAMMPMGHSIGAFLTKSKKLPLILGVCFVLGFLITVAEPDLQVLATQLQQGDGLNAAILYSVALGVGISLLVAVCRMAFNIPLNLLLLLLYGLLFLLAAFVPDNFLAVAFDAGGVTTGPVTVPFLMALGIGLASVRGKNSSRDSFGLVALCSVGPVIAVMIVGLTGSVDVTPSQTVIPQVTNAADAILPFFGALPRYLKEVALALFPVVGVFLLFQIFALRLPAANLIRIGVGVVYAYFGLSVFLTGVNVGFMPMGAALGEAVALSAPAFLIPLGVVMGCCVILAEPAVHVLNKQVEDLTGGTVSRRKMLLCLALGVSASVGLAMLRVLTSVSIWYFVAPAYAVSLLLSFFVPDIFTAVAFDSGGVASGPTTATFILPFAVGACSALGGNLLTDAYGLVAFVAMTPLLSVQMMGLIYRARTDYLPSLHAYRSRRYAKRIRGDAPESEIVLPDAARYSVAFRAPKEN